MKLHALLPLAILGFGLAQGPIGPARPGDFGRPPGPPPQKGIEELRQYLGLTDDQIQQIQKARDAGRGSMQGLSEQVRAKESELRSLIESGTMSLNEVGKLTLDIDALRSQMRQSVSAGRENMLGVLSSEQTARLRALEDAARLRPMIEGAVGLGLLNPSSPPEPPPLGPPR
jgi:Spy/CpxP family protein refolding chaperone